MAADVFMQAGRFRGLPGPGAAIARRAQPHEDSSSEDDSDEGGGGAGPSGAEASSSSGHGGPRGGRRGGSGGSGGGRPSSSSSSSPGAPQIIHSGHFMVSSPHSEHPPKKGYDFDTVNEQTCQTYRFGPAGARAAGDGAGGGGDGQAGGPGGPGGEGGGGGGGGGGRVSIDTSLTKLFECMTLAYSGKLVSPKWKNFKGLKLQCRDKIRLNNAIWRAWYMQYLEKRKNPVCHFVTPLDGSMEVDEHRRPEAIAVGGSYWKRRIEVVIREYHKWRTYFKKRLQKHKDEDLSSLAQDTYSRETPMELEAIFSTDILMSEMSDTLFSTLSSHQPNSWTSPRETAHMGNADMIQPGLSPLQPNCMDTFDFFQDLFSNNSSSGSFLASITPASGSAMADACSHPSQTSDLSLGALHNPLPTGNFSDGLVGAPGPAPLIPTGDQCLSLRSRDASLPPSGFTPEPSLSSQPPFLPAFPAQTLLLPDAPPQQTLLPLSPGMASPGPVFPPPPGALEFGLCPSLVITHMDSSVPMQNVPPTTFSHGPTGLLATQHPARGGVPCSLALQSLVMELQPRPAFVHPAAGPRARCKKPQKIVPGPQPDRVSLVLNKAFIPPAAFQGQSGAVVVTPAPLKRGGLPAPRLSQPHVAIAPSGMAGAPRATEFHGGILLSPGPLCPSPRAVPAAVPHIFSPSAIQGALVKSEQAPPPHSGSSQAPSPSLGQEGQRSERASPCPSEQSLGPQSPHHPCSGKTAAYPQMAAVKNRRMKHISAEQKRRFNIKSSFSTLNSLVPASSKSVSHALTLQKTVDYVAKLQQERAQVQDEARRLREEIEALNAAIICCQQQLPATGVPITRQRFDQMRSMFEEYVKNRTLQNWKFWIFSIIVNPLFETFNGMVSTTSFEELQQTALAWVDRHCSLPVLRPTVLTTLRQLSTTTSILTDPSRLREQAIEAVSQLKEDGGEP